MSGVSCDLHAMWESGVLFGCHGGTALDLTSRGLAVRLGVCNLYTYYTYISHHKISIYSNDRYKIYYMHIK